MLQSIRSSVNLFGQRRENMILGRLSKLPLPILTVWGEEDIIIPASQTKAVARLLPRSIVNTIPNCGHWPHMEQEDTFNELLANFLREDLNREALMEQPDAATLG